MQQIRDILCIVTLTLNFYGRLLQRTSGPVYFKFVFYFKFVRDFKFVCDLYRIYAYQINIPRKM